MTTYVTYQCSVCRRTTDIEQDTLRALPAQCTITKGCSGSLYKIGQSLSKSNTPILPGVIDWYPRGKKPSARPTVQPEDVVSLSTSTAGTLTIALRVSNSFVINNPQITMVLRQRLTSDVPYSELVFRPVTQTSIISGRDVAGKNLRFDQAAIDNDRVQVSVNGVVRTPGTEALDFTLQPNVISFNQPLPPKSVVTVLVFSQAPTTLFSVNFTRNDYIQDSINLGSWGNVRFFNTYVENIPTMPGTAAPGNIVDGRRWWVYTATSNSAEKEAQYLFESITNTVSGIQLLPSSSLSYSDGAFIASKPPHGNLDRYLNTFLSFDKLKEDFNINTKSESRTELYVSAKLFEDINPPFHFLGPDTNTSILSFISKNTATDERITNNDSVTYIPTPKTIGPV